MSEVDVTSPLHERATLAVLAAVARNRTLLDDYVLKGGFALFHVFGSPRRSYDLDFTAIKPFSRDVTPAKHELLLAFCSLLEDEMAQAGPEHGFGTMRVHWRTFSSEMPVLLARIGYSEEVQSGDDFRHYVETQVTLSEIICETSREVIGDMPVHVPVLEDILADKLKALLQQMHRDVHRTRDLYDLWYFTTQSRLELDRERLLQYLLVKCAGWRDLQPVTAARFQDPAVRAYARVGYEDIPPHLTDASAFVPYEEAFDAVAAFVKTLGLPGS